MRFEAIGPAFLVLAIAFSWSRSLTIFAPGTSSQTPAPLLTMIASAVNLSCLGLAFCGRGLVLGCLMVLGAIILATLVRTPGASLAVTLSAICQSIYLYSL